MNVGTMTSKGQITIPAAIREKAGLKPGMRVEFVTTAHGKIHLRPLNATAEDFFNCLAEFESTGFTGTDDEAIELALLGDTGGKAGLPVGGSSPRGNRRVAPKTQKTAA